MGLLWMYVHGEMLDGVIFAGHMESLSPTEGREHSSCRIAGL